MIMQQQHHGDDTEDLIRLDSTTDIDDFDPLKTSSSPTPYNSGSGSAAPAPLSLSNPLYTYENHNTFKQPQNGSVPNKTNLHHHHLQLESNRNDQDLLQEYGLDFKKFNVDLQNQQQLLFDPLFANNNNSASSTSSGSSKVNSQSQWTRFD